MCAKGYKTSVKARKIESDALFSENKKRCGRCFEIKEVDKFSKDKYMPNGLSSVCKSCTSEYGYEARLNPETKIGIMMSRYKTDRDSVVKFTNISACEICGCKFGDRDKCFDHDHKTGLFRGALCTKCNWGIGHFMDNIEIMKSAIIYLEI